MKILLTFAAVSVVSLAFAQKVTYYGERDTFVEDSTKAVYYVVRSSERGSDIAYYMGTNRPRYIEVKGRDQGDYSRTYYYRTGEVMTKVDFHYSFPRNELNVAYPDGKPLAEFLFPDSISQPEFQLINYWDASGNKVVDEGNGTVDLRLPLLCYAINPGVGRFENGLKEGMWKGTSCSGGEYEETYEKGLVTKGVFTKDGQTYAYTRREVSAVPAGGVEAYYKHVAKTMKYPVVARRKGVEGTVYVEFVVNKDGTVSDVRTVKGISKECNEEAERAVRTAPITWTPGYQRGMPVKTRFVLPIHFNLG